MQAEAVAELRETHREQRPISIGCVSAPSSKRLNRLIEPTVRRSGEHYAVVTETGIVAKIFNDRPPLTLCGRNLIDEPVALSAQWK